VDERISYGTTVMFSLGRDLVGFVSQPKRLSFFTASPKLTEAIRDATIHFAPETPLPPGLVQKIVKARLRENAAVSKATRRGSLRADQR
jgi:uncharacterized protein YdhG (YjbR/CyaY superfamily)